MTTATPEGRTPDQLRDDIASLRRTAIDLRAMRRLSAALECEAILRQREADLAAAERP